MKKKLTIKQHSNLKKLGYKGGKMIGDLVEFLGDEWDLIILENNGLIPKNKEFCNRLYQAVKEMLVYETNRRSI